VNLLFTSYISGNSVKYGTLNQNIFQISKYLVSQHDEVHLHIQYPHYQTPRPSKMTEKLSFFPSFTFFSLSSHPAFPSLAQPFLTPPLYTNTVSSPPFSSVPLVTPPPHLFHLDILSIYPSKRRR